ncbi:MAG: hypothetical protein HOQ05_06060 [Corynebacteriales bacterium]|nr:hypothetical protein [Mycobacteriales bacterium]
MNWLRSGAPFVGILLALAAAPAIHAAEPPHQPIPPQCQPDPTKTPSWVADMNKVDPIGAKKVTDSEHYLHWRHTTTSDCGDLRKVNKPQWRTNRDMLFHPANARSAEHIFNYGFEPGKHDGSMTVPTHFEDPNSAVVNVRHDPLTLFDGSVPLYFIDAPGGFRAEGTNKTDVVSFPGGLHTRTIKGMLSRDKKSGDPRFTPNPHFGGTQPGIGEFDLIAVHRQGDFHISVTSGGTPVGAHTTRFQLGTTVTLAAPEKEKGVWTINGVRKGAASYYVLPASEQYVATILVTFEPLDQS